MKISVAMCTFNGERFLSRQLSSIATQSRLPDELLVNDDGSTDATVKLVENFAGVVPFPVEVSVNERHLGVTRNFESVIRRCSGDVIVLCDQDDVWLPHRLEVLEEKLSSAPETAVAFSDAYLINENGKRTGDRLWGIVGFGKRQQAHLRRDPFGQLMGRSIVSGCTLAVRADHRDLILPFPSEETNSQMRVLHDRWISLVLAPAFGLEVIDEPLVEYRLHPRQRVGIPALQIRKLVPSSMLRWRSAAVPTKEHVARLRATIELLETVSSRLEVRLHGPRRDTAIAKVTDAIAHLRARESLDETRFTRVPGLLRELGSGRYQRYSLGLASAFADLVRPRGS